MLQSSPRMTRRSLSMVSIPAMDGLSSAPQVKRHSYQVINSKQSHKYEIGIGNNKPGNMLDLLRVIRKGPAVKSAVDEAIDQCSIVYNLRDAIEESRARAEEATDERQKRIHAQKGASCHSILSALIKYIPTQDCRI